MSDEEFVASVADALSAVRLEAVIVGMIAARLQGAPVLTQDVDILVRDTKLNRKKLERFAEALGGVGPVELSPLSRVRTVIGARAPVDILFDSIAGALRFEALKSRAVRMPVGKRTALVACLEDVIASKEAAGRPKD